VPKLFQQVPMSQILIDDSININEISNEKSKNYLKSFLKNKELQNFKNPN
jgi:hypothetical protein